MESANSNNNSNTSDSLTDNLLKTFTKFSISTKCKPGEYEKFLKEIEQQCSKVIPTKCKAINKNNTNCSNLAKDGQYCTRHAKLIAEGAAVTAGGPKKGSQCSAILKNGERCKTHTLKDKPKDADGHYCYRHFDNWEEFVGKN
jgi:hypothetical protein